MTTSVQQPNTKCYKKGLLLFLDWSKVSGRNVIYRQKKVNNFKRTHVVAKLIPISRYVQNL